MASRRQQQARLLLVFAVRRSEEPLGPRDWSEGNRAHAECPRCGHTDADFELSEDSYGFLVFVAFTCRACGETWI